MGVSKMNLQLDKEKLTADIRHMSTCTCGFIFSVRPPTEYAYIRHPLLSVHVGLFTPIK
jgi:hypothetical protein